jgi:hypothetical protein
LPDGGDKGANGCDLPHMAWVMPAMALLRNSHTVAKTQQKAIAPFVGLGY